jgi:hypothetical protein
MMAVRPGSPLAVLASLLVAGSALACAAQRAPRVVDAGIVPVQQPAADLAGAAPAATTPASGAAPPTPALTSEAMATDPAAAELAPSGEPAGTETNPPVLASSESAAATGESPKVQVALSREPQKTSLRDLCNQPGTSNGFVDASRRRLEETFCGATLWFDGLFGGTPDITNARATSGRIELSGLHTDFHGFDGRARLRVNYDLPNMERRVRLMLGRDDPEVIKTDRQEGFAIRSSVFGLEDRDEWLAGLGYRPPGRYLQRVDFGVGARVKTSPEVFVQGRYRRNFFLGRNDIWRIRETVFWENRDGFGTTASLDWDRVLRHDLLVRWGNVGTISEATDGLEWRSALVLYHNLRGWRAIAGETFWRGATDAEVKLREIGARAIYRHPLQAPHLFGDLIVGYTWPREEPHQKREGSLMVGIGFELLFGQEPY